MFHHVLSTWALCGIYTKYPKCNKAFISASNVLHIMESQTYQYCQFCSSYLPVAINCLKENKQNWLGNFDLRFIFLDKFLLLYHYLKLIRLLYVCNINIFYIIIKIWGSVCPGSQEGQHCPSLFVIWIIAWFFFKKIIISLYNSSPFIISCSYSFSPSLLMK